MKIWKKSSQNTLNSIITLFYLTLPYAFFYLIVGYSVDNKVCTNDIGNVIFSYLPYYYLTLSAVTLQCPSNEDWRKDSATESCIYEDIHE